MLSLNSSDKHIPYTYHDNAINKVIRYNNGTIMYIYNSYYYNTFASMTYYKHDVVFKNELKTEKDNVTIKRIDVCVLKNNSIRDLVYVPTMSYIVL